MQLDRQCAGGPLDNGVPMDLATFARRQAVAVRILVNMLYVAIVVWSISVGHWPYGLIVVPFLAYGVWRLWVLLRTGHGRAQRQDR